MNAKQRSNKIVKRLKKLGMSQAELGRRAGVSRQRVGSIIKCQGKSVTTKTCAGLEFALGFKKGELM